MIKARKENIARLWKFEKPAIISEWITLWRRYSELVFEYVPNHFWRFSNFADLILSLIILCKWKFRHKLRVKNKFSLYSERFITTICQASVENERILNPSQLTAFLFQLPPTHEDPWSHSRTPTPWAHQEDRMDMVNMNEDGMFLLNFYDFESANQSRRMGDESPPHSTERSLG